MMMSRWKAEDDAIYIQFVWMTDREGEKNEREALPLCDREGAGPGHKLF
jgi:hypothetical protein